MASKKKPSKKKAIKKNQGDDNVILGRRPGTPVPDPPEGRMKPSLGRGQGRPSDPDSPTRKAKAEALAKKAEAEAEGKIIGGKGKAGKKGEKVGNVSHLTLTPKVAKIIVAAVERGNWKSVAAKLAGIPELTFYSWVRRGEKHLKEISAGERLAMTKQAHLVLDLAKAEGKVHDFHNTKILKDASPELRFKWLTSRFKKEWSGTDTSKDDATGEEVKVDLVAALLDRMRPLQEDSD